MMRTMKEVLAQLTSNRRTQNTSDRITHDEEIAKNSYADAARRHQIVKTPQWIPAARIRIPTIEELYIPERTTYEMEDLIDLYFYMNLQGNLGVIRRSSIRKVFQGREDTVLNFNYHPSSRAGVGQIVCPKKNAQYVTNGLRKKGFQKLPEGYNPLELSPRKNSLGERRKSVLQRHKENTVRSWARCAKIHREEAVAQLF